MANLAEIIKYVIGIMEKGEKGDNQGNGTNVQSGELAPLPYDVTRRAVGTFGFSQDQARVEIVETVQGQALMETSKGETVIHRRGDPASPLIRASAVVQRLSMGDGDVVSEVGQSDAVVTFSGVGRAIGTQGSFSVGTRPELTSEKKP